MAEKQLSDGGPDGTVLGQSASDLVALHGATPVAQSAVISSVAVSVYSTDIGQRVNEIIAVLIAKGLIASS